MRVELRIERVPDRLRAAAAWLIPGADPKRWLAELARWRIPLEGVRLLPLPDGLGVLAVPPSGCTPSAPSACAPYTRVGGRLFLPVDAELAPEIGGRALETLLYADVYVFHPRAGLVAVEPASALRVDELLVAPVRTEVDWGRARAGPPPLPELRRIEAFEPPAAEALLASGRDDIGTLRDEALPKVPGERDPHALDRARRAVQRRLGEWAVQAAALAPTGAELPAWLDPLRARLAARVKSWIAPDEEARRRELERLVHMLETDPDRGLRHARPLGPRAGERTAPRAGDPGLVEREPRLDLSRAAREQPSAPSEIDPESFARLRELYRAAAERELRLGRFRRAAYVYFELLRDDASAAAALERGGHWLDAATVHLEHLHNPIAAGECLERGGLLARALELYERSGEHERAARLHRRLEREDLARAAFQRAVDEQLARGEVLEAARLLEREMEQPDEALAVLAAHWPRGRRAGAALRERFALLARLGRATELRALVPRLVAELDEQDAPGGAELAGALAELARRSVGSGRTGTESGQLPPDTRRPALGAGLLVSGGSCPDSVPVLPLPTLAEDGTRAIAARVLWCATGTVAERLLAAVAAAAPEDRLLARDTQRWLERARGEPRRGPRARPGKVELVREFRFADVELALRAVGTRTGLAVLARVTIAGHAPFGVIETDFEGEHRCTPIPRGQEPPDPDVTVPPASVLAVDERGALLAGTLLAGLFYRPDVNAPFEHRAWIPRDVLCAEISRGRASFLRSLDDSEELAIARYAFDGELVESRSLGATSDFANLRPACLIRDRDTTFASLGNTLVRVQPGRTSRIELVGPIRRLVLPHHAHSLGVVACIEQGCALLQASARELYPIPIARDLERPLATFALSGRLVVAAGRELRVYAIEGRDARVIAQATIEDRPLIDLLPAGGPQRVALVDEAGSVRVFELPRV